jgi:hypothetical protein
MRDNGNGSDPLAHTVTMECTEIEPAVARRLTDESGRRAFAIPKNFTPDARPLGEIRREVELAVL